MNKQEAIAWYERARARRDALSSACFDWMATNNIQDFNRLPANLAAEMKAAADDYYAAEEAAYGSLREQAAVAHGKGWGADSEWE